jgi:hypothetical protein
MPTIASIREAARAGTIPDAFGKPARGASLQAGPAYVTCLYVRSASSDRRFDEYIWTVNTRMCDEATVHRLLADAWRRTDFIEPGNGAPIVGLTG